MAGVTLRGVRKSFGKVEVIKGVDLDIADEAVTVFVGPSGCGKSTLLRLIAGLEAVTAGEIRIGGKPVTSLPPARRGIAMVFQSYALYPHMTVYDNMAFGLKRATYGRRGIRERVRAAARTLQIEELLPRKPRELSGGQRQRVAIGRAIVREPRVFLLDEPLSNLDAALRVQMRLELARLKAELRATMIYVTHDQVEAMTLADIIVVLNAGRVEQAGAPLDLYHNPRNLFVAGFIGSPGMNTIETEALAAGAAAVTVALPGGTPLTVPADPARVRPGDRLTLGIRPEHLREDSGAEAAGRVVAVERLGAETYLHVRAGPEDAAASVLVLRAGGDSRAAVGDILRFGIPAEACHLFDREGVALGAPATRRPRGS